MTARRLHPRHREYLRFRIVPGQDSTYEALETLKRSLHAPLGAGTYFDR